MSQEGLAPGERDDLEATVSQLVDLPLEGVGSTALVELLRPAAGASLVVRGHRVGDRLALGGRP